MKVFCTPNPKRCQGGTWAWAERPGEHSASRISREIRDGLEGQCSAPRKAQLQTRFQGRVPGSPPSNPRCGTRREVNSSTLSSGGAETLPSAWRVRSAARRSWVVVQFEVKGPSRSGTSGQVLAVKPRGRVRSSDSENRRRPRHFQLRYDRFVMRLDSFVPV